jgi:predicted transcriptional regulator
MTKLLEKAIEKIRKLSELDQDAVAVQILAMADASWDHVELDEEARAAIREGLDQARRGQFVSDEEIEAIWQRYGL